MVIYVHTISFFFGFWGWGMSTKQLLQLQSTVEEEIDLFYQNSHSPEEDAVYLLERVNRRIMSTIFTREEKIELISIAAAYFLEKGLAERAEKIPTTFLGKFYFLFLKDRTWPLR